MTSKDSGKQPLDVLSGLNKDPSLGQYPDFYATLKPNQKLIGVYGRHDSALDLLSVGFIVSEEII